MYTFVERYKTVSLYRAFSINYCVLINTIFCGYIIFLMHILIIISINKMTKSNSLAMISIFTIETASTKQNS